MDFEKTIFNLLFCTEILLFYIISLMPLPHSQTSILPSFLLPNINSRYLPFSLSIFASVFQDWHLYVIYRLLKQYLSRNYRFFDQFLYLKYHLRRLFFTEKRIVFTATRAIKAMRFKSLKKQYSILNILVLNHNQHKS